MYIPNINMVVKFTQANENSGCKVTIKAGRLNLDGKSIMNMFTLDITRPVLVVIKGSKKETENLIDMYRLYGFVQDENSERKGEGKWAMRRKNSKMTSRNYIRQHQATN